MSRFEGTDSYIATDDLMMAVNAAITLERPLRTRMGLMALDMGQNVRYNSAYTSHTH